MGRKLSEAKLTTRNARQSLKPGLYWRSLDDSAGNEVHLGFRKGKRGGSWLVRWRCGEGYKQRSIGTADDIFAEGTRDYEAAKCEAIDTVIAARREARVLESGPLLTVRLAVESYVKSRDERDSKRQGRSVRSDASYRLGRYVVGLPKHGRRPQVAAAPLADVALHDLGEEDLLEWRETLPLTLKGTTKQRLINDLKAALNGAYADNRKRLPPELPISIKHGLRAIDDGEDANAGVARDNQILTDAEVARVICAAREVDAEQGWEGDLYRMVIALAVGPRFSQVARMLVGDVDAKAKRLFVPPSRKGKTKKVAGTWIAVGDDIVEALLPALLGRPKDAPLLVRWRSKQISGTIRWERDKRGPWQSPSELTRPWDAIRQRAGLPDIIPYALRHSSIVRGIRANLPIRLVAALHDTSVAMIERHYGRFIADGLVDLVAKAVVPLVPPASDNIIELARR